MGADEGSELTFFRLLGSDEQAEDLLEPSEQYSTPWGEPDHGPCDKCGGTGRTRWHCRSCIDDPRRECPACHGREDFEDTCPACEGTGEISRTRRDGVSVFPTLGGLRAYMAERGVEVSDGQVVELAGELSDDVDLDADAGALLIRPSRVVSVRALDHESGESG